MNGSDFDADPITDRALGKAHVADGLCSGKPTGDPAENVGDLRTEQCQNCNHDDGDQDENQRVLDQTLTFFSG